MRVWQGCTHKDDTAVDYELQYEYLAVQRWDIEVEHLWYRSRWINCRDATSDANCPQNIDAAPIFRQVEYNNFLGGKTYCPIYVIKGVTKDSAGDPLAQCVVRLYRTSDNLLIDTTLSDNAGNYTLYTPYPSTNHYCVAYKQVSPNVTGATVNTLQGAAYP